MMPTQTPPQRPLVKKITRTGRNGTFTGKVTVHFGHRLEPNPKPNLHRIEHVMREVHVVRGEAEELTYMSPEFFFRADALAEARKMEMIVTTALERMANEPKDEDEPVRSLKIHGYE